MPDVVSTTTHPGILARATVEAGHNYIDTLLALCLVSPMFVCKLYEHHVAVELR
jgi:hypothetical protein